MKPPALTVLSADECSALLASGTIGRVGYVVEGRPVILPVDYVLHQNQIVFRTSVGQKLLHVPLRYVCFEIDGEADGHIWSVLVQGFARDVTAALGVTYKQLREVPITSHLTLQDPHWIAIDTATVTGRRLGATG